MLHILSMNPEEKVKLLEELEKKAETLRKDVDYYKMLEQSKKLVLNQSYGAFANSYFLLFNNQVAGSITAEGRALIKKMGEYSEKYWYLQWHKDTVLHKKLYLSNIKEIPKEVPTTIYMDTDSVDKNTYVSIIRNGKQVKMPISEWYNLNEENGNNGETIIGHESVKTDDRILNYLDNGDIVYSNVTRVIRHKVTKKKWKLKTKSGKEIFITNDHSLIVFRDGKKIEVKPIDVLKTDKILVVDDFVNSYFFDEIETIEEYGMFEDEYVYDVEVDDPTHTFIANDILVHNSLFLTYEPAINHSSWKNQTLTSTFTNSLTEDFCVLLLEDVDLQIKIDNPHFKGVINLKDNNFEDLKSIVEEKNIKSLIYDGFFTKNKYLNELSINLIPNFTQELDFIHALDYHRIGKYFAQCLTKYAESYGVENIQDFELEKIAEGVINIEKKRYIQHLAWEDGVYYDKLKYIQTKGFDIVRSSTPTFARGGKDKKDGIMKVINYLFTHPKDFNIKDLLKIVKELRRDMELADIDDISGQTSCSKYNAMVVNDKTGVEVMTGAHFAVKAAAFHNFLLNSNPQYLTKYDTIKAGDKVKYYYCSHPELSVFAYKRGEYPIEIAPPVNYDEHFFRSVLSPINSLVITLNMPEINKRLSVVMDLFGGLS